MGENKPVRFLLLLLLLMRARGFRKGRPVQRAGDVSGTAAAGGTMESNPATLGVFGTRSFGHSLDSYGAARGTDQRFLVPIRRDQNQRFRSSVLFNAPTSHGPALPAGYMARIWLPHLKPGIYRLLSGRAKDWRPSRLRFGVTYAQVLAGVLVVARVG